MISLRHVSTSFTGRGKAPIHAVDDVSLDVPRGSIQGIIGFSGAGKSTLLRNVNLLERPSSGEVHVGGTELTALGAEELRRARHQIGMIFQGFNLVNNLTVLGNVELSLKFAGVKSAARRRARAAEALEIVDITDKQRSYPAQLSGGQKQRVAIARALATKPEVLLCDEPTSALDPFTTATVLQYLADANREFGITVVIVTHEMEVIKALADHVAVMEDGRIVERFAAAELTDADFTPQTAIGRYLVSDGISIQRERPAHGADQAPDTHGSPSAGQDRTEAASGAASETASGSSADASSDGVRSPALSGASTGAADRPGIGRETVRGGVR